MGLKPLSSNGDLCLSRSPHSPRFWRTGVSQHHIIPCCDVRRRIKHGSGSSVTVGGCISRGWLLRERCRAADCSGACENGWLWPLQMGKCIGEGATRGSGICGARRCLEIVIAGSVRNHNQNQCGRGGLGFLVPVRLAARRLGGSVA